MPDNKPESKPESPAGALERRINSKRGGRPKVKHGGYAYLAKGKVTEKRQRHIQLYLDAARQGLVDDLSAGQGEDALPAAKVVMIDRAIALLGILRLIEEYAATQGIIGENGELTPPLGSSYISYQNSLRQVLSLLGLERKTRTNEDLEAYLQRRYRDAHEATAAATRPAASVSPAPLTEDAPPSEIVVPRASGKGISE